MTTIYDDRPALRMLLRALCILLVILSLGCAPSFLTAKPAGPGDYRGSIVVDGIRRSYLLHLPPAYGGGRPLPLVLALHGVNTNARMFERTTGLSDKADQEGFIVVYPEGQGWFIFRAWMAVHCCLKPEEAADDVRFISALLDELEGSVSIDGRMVYVTGFSNGAMLAHLLAARLSDRVSAIAPVSGTIGGRPIPDMDVLRIPPPSGAVSVLAIHGMKDDRVSYSGGAARHTRYDRQDISAMESVSFWAEHDGCNMAPVLEVFEDGNVRVETFKGCREETEVTLMSIGDGTHIWPRIGGKDAADVIWEFFKKHSK